MLDQISQQRLVACHPSLQDKIQALDNALVAQQIQIRVVQGFRTYPEQDALYAQGRTTPGGIVTYARGGWSNHNFGMAVDCVPDTVWGEPWSPDWDGTDVHYAKMVAAGQQLGLVAGAEWHMHDYPHFQLAEMPVTPTDAMRADFANGGVDLVWQNADNGEYNDPTAIQ
jgi:peptidoglycan L-alanyl-D-glutamate endopeptidase CwlK